MDACYSHIAITHPYPGGFSRNVVEKVWLHRSFLATWRALTLGQGGQTEKVMPSLRSCRGAAWVMGHRINLRRFPQAQTTAWDAIDNSVAKRLLRPRRQLSPPSCWSLSTGCATGGIPAAPPGAHVGRGPPA